MNDEGREERTDLVVKKSLALEVTETSFSSLCFANPARIHNPKMCFFSFFFSFFFFFFFHPMVFVIQSKEVLRFQIPFSSSRLCFFFLFYKPMLIVLNIPPALHRNSRRRENFVEACLCVFKFLNKTSVTEPFFVKRRRLSRRI